MSEVAVLSRCAPTALSTICPQKVRSALASSNAYPEPAVISAVFSTVSFGLDPRPCGRLAYFGKPASNPAFSSRSM